MILCEGESDCHTLWFKGFDAIGVPGATTWNEERDAPQFDSVETIYVVIEPDAGGEAILTWLSKSKIAGRARLLKLEGYKDPSALYLDHPDDFPERLRKAMRDAIPLSRMLAEKAEIAKTAVWERCKHLAKSDDLLEGFAQALIERGVVGEERAAKLLYLVLTTRLLDHPVSAVIKGPSSGGKSFLLDQVLQLFPESAVYRLTAMSERALAYSEADLRNRVLVIFEAVGISGSFASYLVRSLLSEGRLVYEFVEKTANGMRARRIEKSGPTSLLVTTTAIRLHPENETRLLSIGVNDSQEQTGAVLLAIARDANESEKVDVGSWVALQEWLQLGEHQVIIPFASQLAQSIRPMSVRLRRDFGAVLALIKAHAILHQATRQRNENGLLVATLTDYEAVRRLVGDVLAEGVEATVSRTVRETVDAVSRMILNSGREISLTELAKVLELDKSTTSRRVAEAVHRGYLRNMEEKKGRLARLTQGDPLPDETYVLPTVDMLQCCSNEPSVDTPPTPAQGAADEPHSAIDRRAAADPPRATVSTSATDDERFVEVEL